jgi:hypothetical protein
MAEEPPVKRQRTSTFDSRDEFSVDVADFWLRRIENANVSGRGCECMDRLTNLNRTFRRCSRCDAQENELNEQYSSYYEDNGTMSKLSSYV